MSMVFNLCIALISRKASSTLCHIRRSDDSLCKTIRQEICTEERFYQKFFSRLEKSELLLIVK